MKAAQAPAGLDAVLARFRDAANAGGVPIDEAVYAQYGRDALEPIVFAGSLDARTAVMARDLGAQEVRYGEPLIGDAGQRVRKAVYRAVTGDEPPHGDVHLARAMEHILFTNTAPYKPPGNKAYASSVKERFRPLLEQFLVQYWEGDYVIAMGTEAFMWYSPYAPKGAAQAFWKRPERYSEEFKCTLRAVVDGEGVKKEITVAPLPHPSPLNRTYIEVFPEMLAARLARAPLK